MSLWKYTEACEGNLCIGGCDKCNRRDEDNEQENVADKAVSDSRA